MEIKCNHLTNKEAPYNAVFFAFLRCKNSPQHFVLSLNLFLPVGFGTSFHIYAKQHIKLKFLYLSLPVFM
jgi:hypothetical protein